jgi:hypothetical protein
MNIKVAIDHARRAHLQQQAPKIKLRASYLSYLEKDVPTLLSIKSRVLQASFSQMLSLL